MYGISHIAHCLAALNTPMKYIKPDLSHLTNCNINTTDLQHNQGNAFNENKIGLIRSCNLTLADINIQLNLLAKQ